MIRPININYSVLEKDGSYQPHFEASFREDNIIVTAPTMQLDLLERRHSGRVPDLSNYKGERVFIYSKRSIWHRDLLRPEEVVRRFEREGLIVYPTKVYVRTYPDSMRYSFTMYCREMVEEIINQGLGDICE